MMAPPIRLLRCAITLYLYYSPNFYYDRIPAISKLYTKIFINIRIIIKEIADNVWNDINERIFRDNPTVAYQIKIKELKKKLMISMS